MTSTWFILDSESALEGLIAEPFWPGVEKLFCAGQMELAQDLVAALQMFVDNRPKWKYPRAEHYIEWLDTRLVTLPYLMGGGWALGIERADKDIPLQFLISRERIKYGAPLVVKMQPAGTLRVAA